MCVSVREREREREREGEGERLKEKERERERKREKKRQNVCEVEGRGNFLLQSNIFKINCPYPCFFESGE